MGYTKAAARELKATNIRIHAINPGGVNTNLVRSVRPDIDTTDLIPPEEIAETSVRRRTKQP
ncbi:MAG TPA: hypothetical protein DCO79_09700 [Spirochaeta sp.]|nr:hypothetical protein [Spirochaeta sp.]